MKKKFFNSTFLEVILIISLFWTIIFGAATYSYLYVQNDNALLALILEMFTYARLVFSTLFGIAIFEHREFKLKDDK